MNSRDAPTFEFADSSPVRPGRKHRRGRGCGTSSRKTSTAAGTESAAIGQASTSRSFQQGGHKISTVAMNLSYEHQSQMHNYLNQQPQTQANYYTSDAWDNAGSPKGGRDDNSCTGSLTYSASSSVQSAESSNDSSFADIIKLIDSSEGGGASDIHTFTAKKSKAASSSSGGDASLGKETAVSGWMQGVEDRRRSQKKAKENEQKKQTKKPVFSMSTSKRAPSNSNVDLNYSKDDSSEDDVHGDDFDENILETIAGHDDDIARTSVTSQPNPIHKYEEYEISSPKTASTISAPFTPRGRLSGHVTPPPKSRSKRTSSPPGGKTISRTNSRHSKSSSDASFDTPAPSSPPNSTKPPHAARSVSVSKSRGDAGMEDENVVEDLSEAFYAKSWMCGFADAFNF